MKNIITLILITISLVFAHSDGWMDEGMMHGNGYSYLIFIGIIFLFFGILYFMRNSNYKKTDTPIEILNKRLANGEINIEEFNKLRKAINE